MERLFNTLGCYHLLPQRRLTGQNYVGHQILQTPLIK